MKDFLLTALTDLAKASENKSFTPGITLMAGGFLVSGAVVGAKEYFQHSPLTKRFLEVADKLLAEMPESDAPEADVQVSDYIHLKDAHYITANNQVIPSGAGIYIRIRLDHVIGFHFGQLKAEES